MDRKDTGKKINRGGKKDVHRDDREKKKGGHISTRGKGRGSADAGRKKKMGGDRKVEVPRGKEKQMRILMRIPGKKKGK